MKKLTREQKQRELARLQDQLKIEKREYKNLKQLYDNPPFFLMFFSRNN